MCSLAESIQYEMVDETYTVQRCTGVTDRVCDTVYDLAQSTKDDFQCVDIDYQYCWDEDKMVKDRTCIFSWTLTARRRNPTTARARSSARRLRPRSATTPLGRSRRRSASPRPASTARSSPMSSPTPLRSRTATPSP